jgi:MbtH protein
LQKLNLYVLLTEQIQKNETMQDDENILYQVVVNHEEQYSLWPVDRELPLGWNAAGKQGSKQECLDYIEEVWTDRRPLSLP